MKKFLTMVLIFFVVGCGKRTIVNEYDYSYYVEEEIYKIKSPYQEGINRGYINSYITNRLDVDEIEIGLMRHSSQYFPPDKLFFQEGQYIDYDMVVNLLSSKDEGGLNPKKDYTKKLNGLEVKPKYIKYLVEQNYLDEKDDLKGISLALVLNTTHSYKNSSGNIQYVKEETSVAIKYAKAEIPNLLKKIRQIKNLENVPVLILFYIENDSPLLPGNYVYKAYIKDGTKVTKETNLNEAYYLYPSSNLSKIDFENRQNFDNFKNDIGTYFSNFTAVVGRGFYVDNHLKKLVIDVEVIFKGKVELIGFLQYCAEQIEKRFSDNFYLELVVTSIDRTEGVIIRKIDEYPIIYIYN